MYLLTDYKLLKRELWNQKTKASWEKHRKPKRWSNIKKKKNKKKNKDRVRRYNNV